MKKDILKILLVVPVVVAFSFMQIVFIDFFGSMINNQLLVSSASFLATALMTIMAYSLGCYFVDKFLKLTFGVSYYDYKKIFSEVIEFIANSQSDRQLADDFFSYIHSHIRIDSAALFLLEKNSFMLKGSVGLDSDIYNYTLDNNGLLINWLKSHKRPLSRKELIEEYDSHLLTRDEILKIKSLNKEINKLNIHLAIPVFIGDELIAVFTVGKKNKKGNYSKSDIELLFSVAQQFVVGSQKLLLSNEVDAKVKEIMLLQKVAKIVNSNVDIDVVLNLLIKLASDIAHVSRGVLFVYEQTSQQLCSAAMYGLSMEHESINIPIKFQRLKRLLKGKRVIQIDKKNQRLLHNFTDLASGVEGALLVPLIQGGIISGILYLDDYPNKTRMSTGMEDVFDVFAQQIVIAINKAVLKSQKDTHQQEIYNLNEEMYGVKMYTESILQNLNHAVIAVNKLNIVTVFNKAAQQYFSLEHDKVLGESVDSLSRYAPRISSIIDFSNENMHTFEGEIDMGSRTTTIKGHHIPLVEGDNTFGKLIVFTDITQIKELEKQLFFTDRLKSMGTMAASILHEIKNPLSSLKMFANVMKDKYEDPDFWENYGGIIGDEIERLDVIVNNFLGFSKDKESSFDEIKFSELIDNVLRLISVKMRDARIQLNIDLPDELVILGDEQALHQVLINMLINAEQAFPVDQKKKEIEIRAYKLTRDRAVIKIIDNGSGISKEMQEKIFNPFYSTKSDGTGLGLSICKKIITELDGNLFVNSEVGHGTEFIIELPSKELALA